MPLLVDGYNLMHALQASRWGDDRTGRARLCRLLGDWSDARGERVTVVFDGTRPPGALANQIADPRIDVIYSDAQTADVVLAEWLAACSAARRVLVVSSDHEVQRAARRRDAAFERSEDFADRLARDLRDAAAARPPNDLPVKHVGPAPDDGDAWLRQFGFDPTGKEPFEHP